MELFTENGYAATTVPAIAERAGLTTRTFFRHFSDKREVLFLREREFPTVVARLVSDAPHTSTPLAWLMHGLEAAAAGDLERWRDDISARRGIIRSEPQLRERELLKAATLADAMRDALLAGGTPHDDAAFAALTASVLFESALERWLAGPAEASLLSVLREQRRRLGELVAPGDQRDDDAPRSR